jgi:hypothetical protein
MANQQPAAASSSQQIPTEARAEQPPAEAMVALIQTTIVAVLGPLVGQLDAQRQTIERQADTIGQLRADLAAAQAENRVLLARTGPQSAKPTARTLAARLRPLALWLLVALAIATLVVLLVAPVVR